MPFKDAHDLAPETIELLRRIVGRSNVDPSGVDAAMLGAFLCGISNPEQEGATLVALVGSREKREMLTQMEAQLDQIRCTPYRLLSGQNFSPVLVHCMRGAMQAFMRIYCRSRLVCSERAWSDLAEAHDMEAKAIRSLVGSIGDAIHFERLNTQPEPRQGVDGLAYIDPKLGSGVRVRINAEIREDGALSILGSFEGKIPDPSLFQSKSIHLELVDPNGGAVPIGNPIRTPIWTDVLDGFADIVGWQPGTLPSCLFLVGLRGTPSVRKDGFLLRASLVGECAAIGVRLEEPIKIDREQLIVTLTLGEEEREKLKNCHVELLIPVGSVIQTLGTWPMSEWQTDTKTFSCSIQGVINGIVECGSLLRVRFLNSAN